MRLNPLKNENFLDRKDKDREKNLCLIESLAYYQKIVKIYFLRRQLWTVFLQTG